jgi:hypothetical protein
MGLKTGTWLKGVIFDTEQKTDSDKSPKISYPHDLYSLGKGDMVECQLTECQPAECQPTECQFF